MHMHHLSNLKSNSYQKSLFIFSLALILRLASILFLPEPPLLPDSSDSPYYYTVAMGLLEKGGFYSPGTGAPETTEPLYPLFIAAASLIGGGNPVFIKIFQAVLGSLTCLFVFLLFRRIFSTSSGFLAGIILAIHPVLIQQVSRILTETLFTFLLVLLFTLFSSAVEKASSPWFLSTGVVLGLCILTRDIAFYLPLFLFVALFYMMKKKAALKGCLLIGMTTALTVTPWIVRNKMISDSNALIAHEIEMRYWTDPEGGVFSDSSAGLSTAIRFLPSRLRHLFGHPYGIGHLGGNIRYRMVLFILNGLPMKALGDFLIDWRFWYRGTVVLCHYLILALASAGLIFSFKVRKKAAPLYLLFFYFITAIVVTTHNPPSRFLYPLFPFFTGFAAAGLFYIRDFYGSYVHRGSKTA